MNTLISPDPIARGAVRRPWFAALLAFLLLWTVTACSGGDGGDSSSGIEEPTFEYVIPVGSGEKIAQGEALDILPRELDARVGETIMIRNEDTIAHSLGPWFVGPGETLRQRFLTVGVYEGTCSVHPDGAFTVNVYEA